MIWRHLVRGVALTDADGSKNESALLHNSFQDSFGTNQIIAQHWACMMADPSNSYQEEDGFEEEEEIDESVCTWLVIFITSC